MKIYIIVINKKEQYLVDQVNAETIGKQFADHENLNFTRRNAKNINKLSIMGIKYSDVSHIEIIEGKDYNDDDGSIKEGFH